MTTFTYTQLSSIALAVVTWVLAGKHSSDMQAGVAFGYLSVWLPLTVWVLTRDKAI